MPRESYDQSKIIEALKSRGAYLVKIHNDGYMRRGTPDILSCYRGLFLAWECKNRRYRKNPYKALSEEQVQHLIEIRAAGGLGFAVTDADEALRILDEIDAVLERSGPNDSLGTLDPLRAPAGPGENPD